MENVQLSAQLNPSYTFDNFVEGDCNRVARSAGLHIAQKPGTTSFNPLVIIGNVGWGKTHLVHAIGNETKQQNPDSVVLYVSTEKLIEQYKQHLANDKVNDFINFYQMVDTLIIDDIHFLSAYADIHSSFFSIFNHLHQCNKQIILTSDTPPVAIKGLHERILSRFRWGLTAEILAPDMAAREAILRVKMTERNFSLPDDIIKLIVRERFTTVRDMEGFLNTIIAKVQFNKEDVAYAVRWLINERKNIPHEPLTITIIHKTVCSYYNLMHDELYKNTKKTNIVFPRQVVMYFAHHLLKMSDAAIGEYFNKDRTTVGHAWKAVQDVIDVKTATAHASLLELRGKIEELM